MRTVIVSCIVAAACATAAHRVPAALRGYEIVIDRRDSLANELATALKRRGFRVRRAIRGGSRPAAALIRFTFRDSPLDSLRWLHVRLADTRTGVIVAAASVRLDAAPPTPRGRAQAVAEALAP